MAERDLINIPAQLAAGGNGNFGLKEDVTIDVAKVVAVSSPAPATRLYVVHLAGGLMALIHEGDLAHAALIQMWQYGGNG